MRSPTKPEEHSFLTPEIAAIIAIICSIIAAVAIIMLYQLTVPIWKTGFLGMGLLSAWLIPLIAGFVVLDETGPTRTKGWQNFKNVYLTAVCLTLLIRNIEAIAAFSDVFQVVVGYGSPILLAVLAVVALIRRTS